MPKTLEEIEASHPTLFADLDEVQQPLSKFEPAEHTLPIMARYFSRWPTIGPSLLSAIRELSGTVNGQAACDLLHRITKMHEDATARQYGYRPTGKDPSGVGTTYTHNLTRHQLTINDAPPPSASGARGDLDWSLSSPSGSKLRSGSTRVDLDRHLKSLHRAKPESEVKMIGAGHEIHPEPVYTHRIYTGPTLVNQVTDHMKQAYPRSQAGTEHVIVKTDHPAHLVLGHVQKFGVGWKAKDIQTTVRGNRNEDEVDRMVRYHKETGLTVVHPMHEQASGGTPTGVHTHENPAIDLQELHVEIGAILPELHGLATSSVGPEKQALVMLFHEIQTAHNELGNILSCSNQVPDADIHAAMSHFNQVRGEILSALSPYEEDNPAVARPPYRLQGQPIAG